ncbi:MAG: SDR family NAD(P)-dependent oxidoreductase, partial [Methylotenera sp.]|nr:SDR family NAD(P)-dependent oxidoreductase [Flavobacterium sp.]
MTKISILGCGWLGMPLAKALLQDNFLVSGSTTSKDKLKVFEQQGIMPFLIALSENETIGNVTAFLENSEILIIDIPPKLRGSQNENFVSKIKNMIPYIERSLIKNVIFISSTSVY